MKKILTTVLIAGSFFIILLSPPKVKADCVSMTPDPMTSIEKGGLTFTADVTAYNETDPSKFKFEVDCGGAGKKDVTSSTKSGSKLVTVSHKYDWNPEACEFYPGSHKVSLFYNVRGSFQEQCSEIYPVKTVACTIQFKMGNVDLGSLPQIRPGQSITVSVPKAQRTEERPNFLLVVQRAVNIYYNNLTTNQKYNRLWNPSDYEDTFNSSNLSPGSYRVDYTEFSPLTEKRAQCSANFYILNTSQTPLPTSQTGTGIPADACGSITPKDEKNPNSEYRKCTSCIKDKDNPGSWSALGCIPTGPEKFIQWLLNSAINIVGGLAFLMILFGSFKVATSSGNPESLNEGKEIIFAALAGLLFIVFSVILLKIIGHDILQIPGFQ